MIVKNGGPALARCLESARAVVDEIVVGDTGSTDETRAIALRYGARVLNVPWQNDFGRARNLVLQSSQADWVLFLDADEMLDPEAAEEIPKLLARLNVFGYDVSIWNYVRTLTCRQWDKPAVPNPRRIAAAQAYPAYVEHNNVRLFRRHPQVRFEGRVHEGVADRMKGLGLPVARAGFVIHHLGIAEDDPQERRRKLDLYQALGREKVKETPNDPRAHFELGIGEFEHLHNPARALTHFRRVIELLPRSHCAWMFAGICLVRLGRLQDGLDALQRAEQLGAGGPVLLEARGDAFYQREDFGQARNCYQAAQKQGGHSAVLDSKLGVCEVRLGDREQGLRRIEQAIEREPEFSELYDILVATALWLGNPKLAAQAADRRLAVGKTTPETFLLAAAVRVQLGEWQRAKQIVLEGCSYFPEAVKLRVAMAEFEKL